MQNYKQMLTKIMHSGYDVEGARKNMPPTKLLTGMQLDFKLERLPIVTSKKLNIKALYGEICNFIAGVTDIRDYNRLGCYFWNQNFYKYHEAYFKTNGYSFEAIDTKLRSGNLTMPNEGQYSLGYIYPKMWRAFVDRHGFQIDQLRDLIYNIKSNPNSRYHYILATEPQQFKKADVSQPNCHIYFQITIVPLKEKQIIRAIKLKNRVEEVYANIVYEGYNYMYQNKIPKHGVILNIVQRSADSFLGVPFNIAQYAILTETISRFLDMLPLHLGWTGMNTHIYGNHMESVDKYIKNPIHIQPFLFVKNGIDLDYFNIFQDGTGEIKDIPYQIAGYKSEGHIPADLSVGL